MKTSDHLVSNLTSPQNSLIYIFTFLEAKIETTFIVMI